MVLFDMLPPHSLATPQQSRYRKYDFDITTLNWFECKCAYNISGKRVQPQKSGQRRPCPFSIFIGTKMPFESWYGRGMGMWTCKYIHLPMLIRIYFATQLIHILHVHTQKHMDTQNTWTYMCSYMNTSWHTDTKHTLTCFHRNLKHTTL